MKINKIINEDNLYDLLQDLAWEFNVDIFVTDLKSDASETHEVIKMQNE